MKKYSVTKKALRIYSKYNPKYFPVRILQILFEQAIPYFTLWAAAEIVTALYEGRAKKEVYVLVAISVLGNLILGCLSAVLKRAAETQCKILENNEAAAFNKKTLSLDYDKLENPEIRQHRRKVRENSYIDGFGVLRLRWETEGIIRSVTSLLFAFCFMIEMVSLIARYEVQWLGILLFAGMIVLTGAQIVFSRIVNDKLAGKWRGIQEAMLELNRLGRGYDVNGLDNRIYRQQGIISAINKKMAKKHYRTMSKVQNQTALYNIPLQILTMGSELATYLLVCLYCVLGVFPVGSVIKYVGYLGMLTREIAGIFWGLSQLRTNEPFLQDYLDYFDIKNDMYQGSLTVEKRSDKQFDIEFKDVSFRYSGTNEDALKHINLKVGVGERLAVVGMNGSGKTTFIKLLCRLYDPTEGEVFMNDFNIRKYDYRQYLDLFSVVFQDFNLLALPLGNNVASAEHWDDAKAERLLDEVGFAERYAQMEKKLNTPLYKNFDEDGVNISGGEAQKIALAKALYRDAPFIVLDEPTAALDPIAEAEIYSKFDEIVGDKTAIYISHRLSSCRFCDKIAVFDKGEIVQIGNHEELLQDKEGKYYELWQAQAQYYVEEAV